MEICENKKKATVTTLSDVSFILWENFLSKILETTDLFQLSLVNKILSKQMKEILHKKKIKRQQQAGKY
jgi:hypothetical protein